MTEYESSKSGELAFSIAHHWAVTTHQMLRSDAGIGARRELCSRLHHELHWAYDAIDRNWGFQLGQAKQWAAEYIKPPPVRLLTMSEVTTIKRGPIADKPPVTQASQRAYWVKAQQESRDRAREAQTKQWHEDKERQKQVMRTSALEREERKRQEAARQRLLNEEKTDVDQEFTALLEETDDDRQARHDAKVQERIAPVVEAARRIETLLPKPTVHVMPRCQQERGGRPCGAMAISFTDKLEPACVYCAIQSRRTG